MENLVEFALQEKYSKVKNLRSYLENMKEIIDWNGFFRCFLPPKIQEEDQHMKKY